MFWLQRATGVIGVIAFVAMAIGSGYAADRTVGQIIDDATITTEVMAKLTGDKLSNLTKVHVKSESGVVTLSGTVDSADRARRAVQIASSVTGVKSVVNNIQVSSAASSTTNPPPAPSSSPPASSGGASIDATGVVASVDPASGTITLTDGRVLKTTNQTAIWQPTTMQALTPGAAVFVRGATPGGFLPQGTAAPEWRLGTVNRIDRSASQLVMTDATVVRVTPSTNVHRGGDRLTIDQINPGSEVAVRMASAAPSDASEVSVLWTPPR